MTRGVVVSAVVAAGLAAVLVIPGGPVVTAYVRESAVETGQPSQDWCRENERYNNRDEQFCEVRELTEAASGRLSAETSNGAISVAGGANRRDVRVLARVITQAPSMDDARALAREVSITLRNGRLEANGPKSTWSSGWGRDRRSWWVSYRAEVPSRYDLMLDAANGAIAVEGVSGALDIETANGSMTLTDLGGRVRATTSNGAVVVKVAGTRWEGDGLSVRTSNGSARLELPQNYNAELSVGTNNGSLSLDIPVTVSGEFGRRRNIDTTLGSGGPRLEVRTSNGSLRVGRR
jgi:hypothetical protein